MSFVHLLKLLHVGICLACNACCVHMFIAMLQSERQCAELYGTMLLLGRCRVPCVWVPWRLVQCIYKDAISCTLKLQQGAIQKEVDFGAPSAAAQLLSCNITSYTTFDSCY